MGVLCSATRESTPFPLPRVMHKAELVLRHLRRQPGHMVVRRVSSSPRWPASTQLEKFPWARWRGMKGQPRRESRGCKKPRRESRSCKEEAAPFKKPDKLPAQVHNISRKNPAPSNNSWYFFETMLRCFLIKKFTSVSSTVWFVHMNSYKIWTRFTVKTIQTVSNHSKWSFCSFCVSSHKYCYISVFFVIILVIYSTSKYTHVLVWYSLLKVSHACSFPFELTSSSLGI